ncbi:hypothetical protein SDC9_112550 [bioreactor metagenome]|uniref:Uncharacterized protein n=1 Tax=bioreactor metagenome TaxID=1076179 RepID=A0A645BQZ5_9ZZZZ
MVAVDEELVGGQLGGAVQVDRRGGLVGGERDDLLHAGVDRGLDDVLRPEHVGLDELVRVVLGGVDLLVRGGVDDMVDAVHRAVEPGQVADVAEEPAQPTVVVEQLTALVLLQLVAGVDDDALRVHVVQQSGDERLAERAGATGDQDGRTRKNAHECSGGGGARRAPRADPACRTQPQRTQVTGVPQANTRRTRRACSWLRAVTPAGPAGRTRRPCSVASRVAVWQTVVAGQRAVVAGRTKKPARTLGGCARADSDKLPSAVVWCNSPSGRVVSRGARFLRPRCLPVRWAPAGWLG